MTLFRSTVALVCGFACAAAAASDDAFVAQWPLTLSTSDAGAYRVELDPAVYATTVSPDVRDLVVVNGEGRQVPALLQAAPTATPQRQTRALAWFPLPDSAARAGSDIAAISELDPDGRLRRIQWQPARVDAPPAALLIDTGNAVAPLQALVLDWGVAESPFERTMRVEGSDDLRAWHPLAAGGRLLDLRRGEARLVERRISFDAPSRMRYLRLSPGAGAGTMPAIDSLLGESLAADALALQWQTLAPVTTDNDGTVYRLDARVPVTHVDLELAGNVTGRWSLSVRERDDDAWRVVAGDWLVYRVGGDGAMRTPPHALGTTLRAREWRLVAEAPQTAPAPKLRLGYRPEQLVFVAEGAPPFSLRAGSARAARIDAPVAPLLADLRARSGGDWQPAVATPGARTTLAGDAALTAERSRDWGTWLLWGVLLLGVALVGGFALSLLRAPKTQ